VTVPDHHPPTGPRRTTAGAAWVLLLLAGLAWSIDEPGYLVTLPGRAEQLGAMVAVVAAGWIALRHNPTMNVRGTWFIWLFALLPVISVVGPLTGSAGAGAIVRATRFGISLGILALLSPTWRSDPFALVRTHVAAARALLAAALVSYALGVGRNVEGRLIAQVPALVPPQVAQFAAVAAGLSVVAMLGRTGSMRHNAVWAVAGVAALLLSQTRTAAVALIGGLLIAALALVSTSERTRATLVAVLLVAVPAVVVGSGAVATWFRRGQSEENLDTLTGRTKAWDLVYDWPRDPYQRLFGVGYGDKSVEGLPIDGGYVATFHETGTLGLVVAITIMSVLALCAMLDRRPANRAVALFLVTFVAIASYTETGIGDMSAYVLHLVLAFTVLALAGRSGATGADRSVTAPSSRPARAIVRPATVSQGVA
jgi:MFS family permease